MKKLFTENLATKAMALFLAILTWAYLFIQGNASEGIIVAFRAPEFDPEVFASVVYRDGKGGILQPGGDLSIAISGPKGEVTNLRLRPPRTFFCNLSVDAKDLNERTGKIPLDLLQKAVFPGILPGNIRVQPLPSSSITLDWVKYDEKEVELVVPPKPYEGEPARGYQVDGVQVLSPRIKVKIPANQSENVHQVAIGPVHVGGRDEGFVLERTALGPEAQYQNIRPLQPFAVGVKISPKPTTKTFNVDVTVAAKPDNLKRIKLTTESIKVGVRGPEELINQITPASLVAYIMVTDKDMEPAGQKNMNESAIGCHILDPKLQGKISVTIMPDDKPENRQVKISIEPKTN